MQRRVWHQGGWAAIFVVVGTILVACLISGIYFIKIQTTDRNRVVIDDASDASEIEHASGGSSGDEVIEEKKAKQKENTPETDRRNIDTKEDVDTHMSDQANSENSAVKLPETGPVDVLAKLTAVTILTVVSAAYLRSR
jgi:hypothetical protein